MVVSMVVCHGGTAGGAAGDMGAGDMLGGIGGDMFGGMIGNFTI